MTRHYFHVFPIEARVRQKFAGCGAKKSFIPDNYIVRSSFYSSRDAFIASEIFNVHIEKWKSVRVLCSTIKRFNEEIFS